MFSKQSKEKKNSKEPIVLSDTLINRDTDSNEQTVLSDRFMKSYKDSNEQIVLSDKFLDQLKFNMRQEQARIDASISNNSDDSKDDSIQNKVLSFDKKKTFQGWKHALPVVISACAVIAIISVLPNMNLEKKDDASSQNETCEKAETYEESDATCDMAAQIDDSGKSDEMVKSSNDSSFDDEGNAITSEATTEASTEKKAYQVCEDNTQIDSAQKSTCNSTNLRYTEGMLDFSKQEEFISSPMEDLSDTLKLFQSKDQGKVKVSLDYVGNGRVILHDYYGLLIYDYIDGTILRAVDLPNRIEDVTLQPDSFISVSVHQGGNYLVIDPQPLSSTNHFYYVYETQTDTMISITHQELADLDLPPLEQELSYESSLIDTLISNDDRSFAIATMNQTEQGFLYYQSSQDKSVASLTFCLTSFTESGDCVRIHNYPIYGDDALNLVEENGFSLDQKIE